MRRLVFAVASIVLGLGVAELLASLLVVGPGGGREELLTRRAEVAGDETLAGPTRLRVPRIGNEVVHPFLGYVTDPAINELAERREAGELLVDGQGFFSGWGAPEPVAEDALRVGVFGGSVAFVMAFAARAELTLGLEGEESSPQRTVSVRVGALGGYKQPQQLMSLAWLLAGGERFDIVINLDGFNDIALAVNDNVAGDINPFYPARWSARLGTYDDPDVVRRIGDLRFTRERRQTWARAFERPGVRWSQTLLATWATIDARFEQRVAEGEAAVREVVRKERAFQRFGPEVDFGDDDEMYRELAAFWGRSSRAMAVLAEGHGARYYHFLQPNQYLPGSKPLTPREREVAFQDDSPYRRLVTEGYPYLREEGARLAAEGIRFHDLSMLFEHDERDLYVDVCCHLDTAGSQTLAQAIVEVIRADIRSEPLP
jgi:hypothetical protein